MMFFRYFRPTLGSTLLLLAAVVLFLSLARWQWQRAEEKRQLLAVYEERLKAPPRDLNRISLEALQRYRRARVRGRFDSDHPIWLANRFFEGRLGYELLIPFEIRHRQTLILVNLGWISLPARDPNVLPKLPPLPKGELEIEGMLDRFPSLGLYLQGGEKISGWPAVVSWLDQKELERVLGQPVLAWQLELDPKPSSPSGRIAALPAGLPFGFQQKWRLELHPPPERHLGYAFQWMVFAVVAVVLWFYLNWKRER